MELEILFRDAAGALAGHCSGPDGDGACSLVEPGTVVPCAGHSLVPDGHGHWLPFPVGAGTTVCPVTEGMELAGSPDVP